MAIFDILQAAAQLVKAFFAANFQHTSHKVSQIVDVFSEERGSTSIVIPRQMVIAGNIRVVRVR